MTLYSLCVIGNSHTGAVAEGWKQLQSAGRQDFQIKFFGASSRHLEHLAFDDGVFHSSHAALEESFQKTSGGDARLDTRAFDAFLLVGLRFRVLLPGTAEPYGTLGHLRWRVVDSLLSRLCYDALLWASAADSHAMQIAGQIRSVCAKPVLICPAPFKTEQAPEYQQTKDDPLLSDRDYLAYVYAQYRDTMERGIAPIGAEILWQDDSTVEMPGLSKLEFGQGSFRMRTGAVGTRDDGLHLNADYGRKTLLHALTRLDALSGGRVLDPQPSATLRPVAAAE